MLPWAPLPVEFCAAVTEPTHPKKHKPPIDVQGPFSEARPHHRGGERGGGKPGGSQRVVVPKRIHVSGLPFSATEDSLGEFFSCCGTVSQVRIIVDMDGRSKG